MRGRDVEILRPSTSYSDGDVERKWGRETVGDVLVAPGRTSSSSAADRPDGTETSYTLAFPKTYAKSLRGCRVEIDGGTFAIVGDPLPYREGCPTRWNRTAEAVRADG